MNRFLLGMCAILDVIIAGIYFLMYDTGPDGPLPVYEWYGVVLFLNRIALAAGVCTVAAGLWRPAKDQSWLLVINGVALSAYGVIPLFWRGPLGFNRLALLLIAMAITLGILALAIARASQRSAADEWFFGLAGAVSLGFAVAFLALVNRWIQLERRPFHPSVFLWLCAYFGFTAICMVGLARRPHRLLFFR
jgi:uncharacterized membrane protein HdeD (DUF308 family)